MSKEHFDAVARVRFIESLSKVIDNDIIYPLLFLMKSL